MASAFDLQYDDSLPYPDYDPLQRRAALLGDALQGGMDRDLNKKLFATQQHQRFLDPRGFGKQALGDMYSDSRLNDARNATAQAASQFGQGIAPGMMQMAQGRGPVMEAMLAQATGQGPSVVNRNAAAQRQAQARSMAQTMAASGGYGNPLAMRNMMNAQGQMGQQMASQVAAARAAERQQAQQSYLQARMGAMNAGLGMQQQNFANQNQLLEGDRQAYGAAMGIGNAWHQQGSSFFNENPYLSNQESL